MVLINDIGKNIVGHSQINFMETFLRLWWKWMTFSVNSYMAKDGSKEGH